MWQWSHMSGVTSNDRSIGLDAEPYGVPEDSGEVGPDVHRSVCNQANDSAGQILQLETGPRSDGNGWMPLHKTGRRLGRGHLQMYVCQPPLELDRQSSAQNTGTESPSYSGSSSLENPTVVSQLDSNPDRHPSTDSVSEQSDNTITPISQTSNEPSTSRVACLRGHFRNQGVSEEGSELLLASWRQKSSKSYDGMFRRWVSWCDQWQLDPVSGPISGIINFLTELFKDGYQYRSLNAYRSAISSVHDRADGYEIGQHPLVKRLLRGAFNQRPPKPRYEVTWNVTLVLDYMDTLGESQDLSLQELSWKMVMLMALTRPSRSADLAMLDLQSRRLTPEGVTLQATGLSKQSRPNHSSSEFFFPAFEHNPRLCPKETFKVYEKKTESLRKDDDQKQCLFLAVIKPHKPVSPSTIARWMVSLLKKAGIDTNIFKAHSTRGAATTAAANKGVTMSDILKAADWSSESVFKRFYYKPTRSSNFGRSVLSKQTQLQTTTVDIETEPSEM